MERTTDGSVTLLVGGRDVLATSLQVQRKRPVPLAGNRPSTAKI